MEMTDYLRTVFALLFVLGLIGVLFLLIRQYGMRRFGIGVRPPGASSRLAVLEVRVLDARHRLVLVRRDHVEHLLLLGPDRDLIVEAGIPAKATFDAALARTDDREATP